MQKYALNNRESFLSRVVGLFLIKHFFIQHFLQRALSSLLCLLHLFCSFFLQPIVILYKYALAKRGYDAWAFHGEHIPPSSYHAPRDYWNGQTMIPVFQLLNFRGKPKTAALKITPETGTGWAWALRCAKISLRFSLFATGSIRCCMNAQKALDQ